MEPETIPQLLARQAVTQPLAVALLDGDTTVRYGELASAAARVAAALAREGVVKGERIAILDHDSARLFEVVFGIAAVGAVTVGLNWRLQSAELAFQLQDAGVVLLFVGAEFADRARDLCAQCPALRACVALRGEVASWPSLADWLAMATAPAPLVPVDREDIAVQMYTSGTTGQPKGVMLAHRSFTAVVAGMHAVGDPWIGWSPRDVSLLGIPSFHIGGMWWAMTGFAAVVITA